MCNINPAEIRRRRLVGHVGLAVTLVCIAVALATQSEWYVRLLLFVPAFITATGYLQAREKFCVAFAGAGQQHADEKIVKITDKAALSADSLKARMINIKAFLFAAVLTGVLALLPLIGI